MPKRARDAFEAVPTETTPEGLIRLIHHITHAASHGLLDPEFVRKLGKRVEKEAELLKSSASLDMSQAGTLDEALIRLASVICASEGALLTRAVNRLRAADA